jgi:tRNA(Ile)-lysidine synthase
MEYSRNGIIIRPLLDVTREEIEEYCREFNLEPSIDHSNMEPLYTRNRLRLELLPLIENEYNENIIPVLIRLARIAREDKDYFQEQLEKIKGLVRHDAGSALCRIKREEYVKLHPAVGKRLLAASFKEMGLVQDMTAVHLDGADSLMRSGKTGDRIDFPWKYGLRLEYEDGVLYSRDDKTHGSGTASHRKEFAYPLKINDTIRIPELNATLRSKLLKAGGDKVACDGTAAPGEFSVCLNISGVKKPDSIVVRNRKPGDYIVPSGMKGRKKLQDFLTDKKIPKGERDSIPLVCIGEEVLWIIGYRVNENYIVKKDTSEMLCLEYARPMW